MTMDPLMEAAECRVCGEQMTRLEAPLHAEDHAVRGEYPPDYDPAARQRRSLGALR